MIVLLNKRDAAACIGVNPATLMRMAKEGRFPVPVRLSDHLLAEHRFIESEVEEWVQDRIAARDAMATPAKRGSGRPKGSKNKTKREKPKRKGHPSYATRIARGEKFEDLPAFARSKRED